MIDEKIIEKATQDVIATLMSAAGHKKTLADFVKRNDDDTLDSVEVLMYAVADSITEALGSVPGIFSALYAFVLRSYSDAIIEKCECGDMVKTMLEKIHLDIMNGSPEEYEREHKKRSSTD